MRSALRPFGDADEYVMLLEQSSLQDRAGDPIACPDVRRGMRVSVHCAAYPDGSFGEATVVLQD